MVCACPSVRPSVRPSIRYTCIRSGTLRDRILKFGMWDEYEIKRPVIFLVHLICDYRIIALFKVFTFYYIVSLLKLVNKISQEPLESGS